MNEEKIKARGKISLAEKCPELVKEWDYDKNDKGPEEYGYGSDKKVWWICKYGHNHEMRISSRVKRGCPICNKSHLINTRKKNSNSKCKNKNQGKPNNIAINNFAVKMPHLITEWNVDKNGELTPYIVYPYSKIKVWWKCSLGHEWETPVYCRTEGTGCPICYKNRRSSMPEKIIYYYVKKIFKESKANYYPDWLNGKEIDIYIPELDISIEYDGIYHTLEQDLEKDKLFEELQKVIIRIRVPDLPDLNDNSICMKIEKRSFDSSYLFMNKIVEKIFYLINNFFNTKIVPDVNVTRDMDEIKALIKGIELKKSIAYTNPELVKEWDYEKNGHIQPVNVTKGSHKKIYWKCYVCKHEWVTTVYHRTRGHGCPKCGIKKMVNSTRENKLKKMQYIEKTAKAS